MRKAFPFLLLLLFLGSGCKSQEYKYLNYNGTDAPLSAESGINSPVIIKILYDNYVHVEGFEADWGYSILIDGLEKTILFDTGTKPEVFEANFKKAGIDAGGIDYLVFSHEHSDHTGGLNAFIKMKTGIPVIIPHSFTGHFKSSLVKHGLEPLLVNEPAKICNNLYTSGEFDYEIAEHALILDTKSGLVVMTGCCHPGIIDMLKKIKSDFNKNIYMVFGGFHLLEKSDKDMASIISDMKRLGIVKCGATHCTGDRQIQLFKEAFGKDYFELGVGNVIRID
ncbi:MAG: Metallo-beta-lactamase superfamily protein [Bacteroidetes bacterium ADurb.Bin145]|jgi:7,8-dihydropterin-6-yl-methyl-4-(beta-D-ribofuranosyl)aminobenzene 5'-phosphate synthase|nr:MAG: Metallo-beta-lactamase superfamily protein [Bacteroidetes bacterium ADurb.Bin145]